MATENSVDEHTAEVGGGLVFYRRAPSTGVPVLYLHSVPTSSDDWLPMLERCGGVAPDLPGFGRSGKATDGVYSLQAYADFIEDLLEQSGLGQSGLEQVAIVGHGWGAAAGLVYAQRHPERVARVAILNAIPLGIPFRWPRVARAWRVFGAGELLMGSVGRWSLARILRSGAVSPAAWPDARVDAVWEQFDQGTQRAILRLHRSANRDDLAEAGAHLDRLNVPALIVWGERDPWLAPALADAYAQRLPQATVQRIAGAGHWPWLDQTAVLDRLAEFLAGDDDG